MGRCRICGMDDGEFELVRWKKTHYQIQHNGYAVWVGRFLRNYTAAFVPLVLLIIVSDYLWLESGDPYSYLAGITNLLFIVFNLYEWNWTFRRRYEQFKREWKAQAYPPGAS